MSAVILARWIHILAAAAWLGEVVAVVFVMVPAALRLEGEERARYLAETFPRIFRLASILALITLAAGAWLNYLMTGWKDLGVYLGSLRGRAILVGGALGLGLALFHFIVESRLEPTVESLATSADKANLSRVSTFLRRVPRLGLALMVAIFVLMMIGARGI